MADVRKSYLDACCFIDMVKTKVGKILTKDKETDVWFLKRLLEANRDGEVEIYTSTLTIAECTHGGDGDISPTVKSELNRLLMSGQYVRLVQMTPFIAVDARDLRWNHGITLRGADSIHVSSALALKCEEFLSANGRLARIDQHSARLAKLGIQVPAGRDTLCLPEKYRQLGLDDRKTNN
ncbi:MAG: type II toxin-antitoxin system VapC family toxin [Methylocella sp.]